MSLLQHCDCIIVIGSLATYLHYHCAKIYGNTFALLHRCDCIIAMRSLATQLHYHSAMIALLQWDSWQSCITTALRSPYCEKIAGESVLPQRCNCVITMRSLAIHLHSAAIALLWWDSWQSCTTMAPRSQSYDAIAGNIFVLPHRCDFIIMLQLNYGGFGWWILS